MLSKKLPVPNNVEEAAKQFDERFPGWENKVNIKQLNLTDARDCIIGQVINEGKSDKYGDSIRNLYEKEDNTLQRIFADNISKPLWIEQINFRLNMPKTLTFIEATQALVDGKRVRPNRADWTNSYMELKNNDVMELKNNDVKDQHGVHRDWFVFKDMKFLVVPPALTFKDLKPAQKFIFTNGIEKELIRTAHDNKYFIPRTGEILTCHCPNTDEIKVIE